MQVCFGGFFLNTEVC